MQKVEIENYKNHGIWISDNEYSIFWFRGEKHFNYNVTEELVEKSRKSDKDALEVMFYLEHGRWPKEGELENYNKTDVKTYVGDEFLIYEENGKYEIEIPKDCGGAAIRPVRYPITKELKEKALKSPRDGYEVAIYAETGKWPSKDPEENSRKFIRKNPKLKQELFSKEEYEHLVKLAKEEQEQEKIVERDKEEIIGNPELILWVSEKKRNLFSKEEIERLEVLAKENKKIHKKKIRKRWGKIIAASVVVLIFLTGGLYGYNKITNKNAFEEMYNSYYNLSIYRSVEHMPQLSYHYRPGRFEFTEVNISDDEAKLTYKEDTKKIILEKYTKEVKIVKLIPISDDVSIEINYEYSMNTQILYNSIRFVGRGVPLVVNKQKQTIELLEKYNISKGYIKVVSDKLLDSVLTDWKNFSGSPYSKDNMGKLTIEKDEILK